MKALTNTFAFILLMGFSLVAGAQSSTPSNSQAPLNKDITMKSGDQSILTKGDVTLLRDISTPKTVKIKKAYEVLEQRCTRRENTPVRTCGYSSFCGGGFPRTYCRNIVDRWGRMRRVCQTTQSAYNYCCWNRMDSQCVEFKSIPTTRWADIKIKFSNATKLTKTEAETFELIHLGGGSFDLRELNTLRPYSVKSGGFLKGKNTFSVKGVN